MSVIAHLRIPADSFELGRILPLTGEANIRLESMIPLGEKAVPVFSVTQDSRDAFEETVRNHPSVKGLREVTTDEHETVYALDWELHQDLFFRGVIEGDGHVLDARGSAETWEFELRFPTHETLSEFQEHCANAHIPLEVGRIYNPTRPDSGQWYGLTSAQKETLVKAIRGGYYTIPRQMSTQDLADEVGVSDQAVTERLRRGISTLVENTLLATIEETEEYEKAN